MTPINHYEGDIRDRILKAAQKVRDLNNELLKLLRSMPPEQQKHYAARISATMQSHPKPQ